MVLITLKNVCFSDIQNPRLFGNTLTANDIYYLLNRENLTQPIQMQLPEKQKTFSQFFFALLKSILILKDFIKRDEHHS